MAKKKKIPVEIQTAIVSPDFSYRKGQVVELESDLALKWIKSGVAKPVKERKETAQDKPPEDETIANEE
jgi:hypothetical protein